MYVIVQSCSTDRHMQHLKMPLHAELKCLDWGHTKVVFDQKVVHAAAIASIFESCIHPVHAIHRHVCSL